MRHFDKQVTYSQVRLTVWTEGTSGLVSQDWYPPSVGQFLTGGIVAINTLVDGITVTMDAMGHLVVSAAETVARVLNGFLEDD